MRGTTRAESVVPTLLGWLLLGTLIAAVRLRRPYLRRAFRGMTWEVTTLERVFGWTQRSAIHF